MVAPLAMLRECCHALSSMFQYEYYLIGSMIETLLCNDPYKPAFKRPSAYSSQEEINH